MKKLKKLVSEFLKKIEMNLRTRVFEAQIRYVFELRRNDYQKFLMTVRRYEWLSLKPEATIDDCLITEWAKALEGEEDKPITSLNSLPKIIAERAVKRFNHKNKLHESIDS